MKLAVFALVATLSAPALAAPCDAPEHRAFDFWLGEWNVRTPEGKLAGVNRIVREYGGCVLHERYDTGKGYSGESLNVYDAARKVWHQSWVDSDGLLLVLEGRWDGKRMILEGAKQRITWTPNNDGSVRQLWEAADDKGGWSVVFDGRYTRR